MNNQQLPSASHCVRIVLLLLCVVLFAAAPVFALPASASLHGVVTDPSGARVTKATITLQAEDGTTTTVQSGADGAYIFPQLAPGTYTITVRKSPANAGVSALPLLRSMARIRASSSRGLNGFGR